MSFASRLGTDYWGNVWIKGNPNPNHPLVATVQAIAQLHKPTEVKVDMSNAKHWLIGNGVYNAIAPIVLRLE